MLPIVGVLIAFISCSSVEKSFSASPKETNKKIYIVNYGFHTAIALYHKDLPEAYLPNYKFFSGSYFIQIAWGDKDWFILENPGTSIGLKALFLPTRTTMRIEGFSHRNPKDFYGSVDVIELSVSHASFSSLLSYIQSTFKRDKYQNVIVIQKGKTGANYFYETKPTYHLFNTCNVLTAKAIKKTGIPISPLFSITAARVIAQVKEYGVVVK
ncbi:MAG: DUF2459 domain-containing protein [Leptospiraceae bacterium]|nr:DUF2459 domain-containing protein [Leptospiraceae bacterium]MCP5495356.1 DUF2459 domain-containing protein [Leptospiraceae bacterium]